MGSIQRKEQLKNFLHRFDSSPIILSDSDHPIGPMEEFVITFFGKCFMQGYRIMQKIEENIFVLSLQEFQHGCSPAYKQALPQTEKKHGLLKIIIIQFKQVVNQDREYRSSKFQEVKQIIQFFCGPTEACSGIQVHFLFAHNFLYSKTSLETLQKCSSLTLEKFYNRDYGMNKKQLNQGLKILDEKVQGVRLHQLVELLLKGGGLICNQKHLSKNVLHQAKFTYKLDRIINTICYIIGKQMIEGDFLTISSEKWMRKFSQKKFKKFDLLMRNRKKVCIIDWKFSKVNADEKISTQVFAKKNLEYFQLARKQYNSQVELKFYCFHQTKSQSHHKFTCATYNYSIEEIQIKDFYSINQKNEIQIDSDSSLEIERYIKISNERKKQKQNIFERFDSDVEMVGKTNKAEIVQIGEATKQNAGHFPEMDDNIIEIRQQDGNIPLKNQYHSKDLQQMDEQSKNDREVNQIIESQKSIRGNSEQQKKKSIQNVKSRKRKGQNKCISLASSDEEDQSSMIELQIQIDRLHKISRPKEKSCEENHIGINCEMISDSDSSSQIQIVDQSKQKKILEKGSGRILQKGRKNEHIPKKGEKNTNSKQKVSKMIIKQRKIAAKKDFIEID